MKAQLREELRNEFQGKIKDVEGLYQNEIDNIFSIYQEVKQASMSKNVVIIVRNKATYNWLY